MIPHQLLRDEGILILSPDSSLLASDFEELAREIDPYIEEKGGLKGIMLDVESFPGWHDVGALIAHLRFVKNHHAKIKKVAAVTDSKPLSIVPQILDHFVNAEVKHFHRADREAALAWLRAPKNQSEDPNMARGRILIGKPGLDGHDRGAKYVVRLLRDAGYEVIYTGIRRSPEQIVATAIHERVDAIGLSLLSGAHRVLFKRVIELLKAKGALHIIVFGGGTIHENDVAYLKEMGVKAIFTPGTRAESILATIERLLMSRECTTAPQADAKPIERAPDLATR